MTVTADAAGTWQLGDLTVNRMGLGAMRLPAAPDRAQAIAVLRRDVELGVNHIDTAQFYFSPRFSANELINSALAPYMAGLQKEGLIRHLGISGVTPAHLAEVEAIAPVVCVQNRFAIDDAEDALLDICGQQGIAFVPFFAIAGKRKSAGGAADPSDPVLAVARAHNATPAQVRLAWTLHRGPHVLAIPGTSDPGHLTDNIAAAAIRLSPADLIALQ
jgi:aryl-alcohol dehydrogenase-like predicted oxidoreductase